MRFKILLSLIILMFVSASPTQAEQFGSEKEVSTDKTWTISFNTSIQESSLDGNVYVKQEGNSEPLNQEISLLSSNEISLKAPEKGYLPSERYTLSIDGIKSTQGLPMDEEVTFDFTTAADNNLSLDVHFIDVGQGDSILVEYPNGTTMLVDGGTKSAGEQVVSYLKAAGITTIDQVVSTHPDADHLGGLIPVLEKLNVKSVLDSGKSHTTQTYEEYLTVIDQKNIPFKVPSEGDYLDMHPTITTQVLNVESKTTDNNEASIVLKLTYGNNDVLLTGDAGVEQEQEMINEFNSIEAEILKAGHHGSETSSSLEFIQAVAPEATILSYGEDNRYGHPVDTVVNNLSSVNSDIYSTAKSGNIVFSIRPDDYSVAAAPWSGDGQSSDSEPTPYPINVNEAGYEELQLVNGVGPEIAENIIDYRSKNGLFQTIEELDRVKYIGPATIEEVRSYITLD